MERFRKLFQYDAWANERIVAACDLLPPEKLNAPVEGIFGSVIETLTHLVGVEHAYLQLMERPAPVAKGDDLASMKKLMPEIAHQYDAFTRTLDADHLERRFRVPWFERDITIADGLLQVLVHSTEHRADLASALTRLGVKTEPMDYIVFALEHEPA